MTPDASRRYNFRPLATGGVEVNVPANVRPWRALLWSILNVPIVVALPLMIAYGFPAHVLLVFAVPIAFALSVYAGWMAWQLWGIERYIVTPRSWTYEARVLGRIKLASAQYDMVGIQKPRFVVHENPARFGFEGHIAMGHAFVNHREIQTFLQDVEPYVMSYSPLSPGATATATSAMSIDDNMPVLDDMLRAMMPMLDMSARGQFDFIDYI
ncbi:unnamed protein product [Aphanomyces euteiches]